MKQKKFIQNLSNSELWSQTKTAARDEKAATLLLLDYLIEVERRRLFAERAYSSLFEFVMKELGYSESQAAERINAMRLMKEIPIVKEHIKTGDLSLTTASKIQRFIKSEKKITGKKVDLAQTVTLISECQNKSKREIEKILIQKSSAPLKALTELKISVDEEVIEKLKELQDLTGIQLPEILEAGIETLLSKEKSKNLVKNNAAYNQGKPTKTQNFTLPAKLRSAQLSSGQRDALASRVAPTSASQSRYISKLVRQHITNRSQNRCEYRDNKTNKRCESKFRLQFEHHIPFSVGGKTDAANLLHYCPTHNQLAAIQFFGKSKMSKFYEAKNYRLSSR